MSTTPTLFIEHGKLYFLRLYSSLTYMLPANADSSEGMSTSVLNELSGNSLAWRAKAQTCRLGERVRPELHYDLVIQRLGNSDHSDPVALKFRAHMPTPNHRVCCASTRHAMLFSCRPTHECSINSECEIIGTGEQYLVFFLQLRSCSLVRHRYVSRYTRVGDAHLFIILCALCGVVLCR